MQLMRASSLVAALLLASAVVNHAWAGVPVNVPEPLTSALLLTGIAGLAFVKFRRRK